MLPRKALYIFLVAWVVRLIYVAQISDVLYFDVPLVDGANYFRTAARIAAGDLLAGGHAFWQPPLYPYFLAALFTVVGTRMAVIYAVQSAIGALSCVLLYLVGRRIFGERAGICAALIAGLYGPLVYFDAQPLIPFLHIFLVLLGILFLLRAAGIPELSPAPRRDWLLGGVSWGLAAIATPNILLAVPVIAVWAFRRARAAPAVPLALLLAGVAAPVLSVTARNLAVAGDLVLISSNGGINFFIGNNPDFERTIRIRPGGEFERLAQEPENLGIVSASGRSRYFTARALRFLGSYPGQALRLYGRKIRDLLAGREIPRNQELYRYRESSSLLAALLWRFGIAFPFGVVAPLALGGACLRSGRSVGGRSLLLLFAAVYAVSILLFFPAARYRLPLVPVAVLFAGHLLAAVRVAWRRPLVATAVLGGLLLFNMDAGKASERWPEEEALNRATALRIKGRPQEAREEYLRALALNPRRIDPLNSLAAMAAREGRWEEAAERYGEILEIVPDFVQVRRHLSQAYSALGRAQEARRELQIAVHLAPRAGLALADLCMSYLDEGFAGVAEPYCERAVAARPDLPETHFALGLVAWSLRKKEVAGRELTEAIHLFPPDSPGSVRAREILDKLQ
jgi:tetratricopeptide (TPR) repeat protein